MRAILRLTALALWAERVFAVTAVACFGLWLALAQDLGISRSGQAVAIALAAFIPLVALARLPARELVRLPVSRRHVWLTWCVAGGGVPLAIVVCAEMLAWVIQSVHGGAMTITLSRVTVSAALVATTAALVLAALAGVWKLGSGTTQPRLRTLGTISLLVPILFGPLVFLFGRDLVPIGWREVGLGATAFLAAGAVAAIAAWRFVPQTLAPPSASKAAAPPPPATSELATGLDDLWQGASGKWGLLRQEALKSAASVTFMMALFGLTGIFTGGFEESTTMFLPLAALVNDRGAVTRSRRLRTLPISTAFLSRLHSARPIFWWLSLLVLRSVVAFWAPAIRPTVAELPVDLVTVASVTAARSVSLRWGPQTSAMFDLTALGTLFIAMLAWRFVEKWSTSSVVAGIETGLLAIAMIVLAALSDRTALVARSGLYRIKPAAVL